MTISTLTPVFPPVDHDVGVDFLASGIGGGLEEECEGEEGDRGDHGREQGEEVLPPLKSIHQCLHSIKGSQQW